MVGKTLLRLVVPLALSALLGACTQKNTADEQAQAAAASANVDLGIDRFLLFPNPIGMDPLAQDGGTFETNTSEYAAAYYRAIDPANAKDTIDKWRAANGFIGYASRPGTEHLAVFRDVKDLGYGRRMTARRNSDDNSVAFYVENYKVTPNAGTDYSSELNVEAAIRRDTQWHVGTNAIEWTTTPCIAGFDPADCDSTVKFAKYYNFSSADGTRQLAVDLDGRGKKAMPGPCITCHGGRGDPLTPPDVSGKPRFPLVENSLSRKRGDVEARLHGQNVDSFTYSTSQPGFAKSDMQPFLKDFNQWILCTYPSPTPGTTVTGTWGTCTRPTAGANEWQGTAAEMIQAWYGGPGMPAAAFSDTYVPAGWNTNTAIPGTNFTDTTLYQNVVAPYCRTCHVLRGTFNQNDLDFMSLAKYQSYADRIKVHVFDRGNMPLSLIPHTGFWTSSAPQMLASFIDAQLGAGTATANGTPLVPGRPIADPGPDRMVRTGSNAVLTAENSLFASTFAWSQPSPSGNVTISNPNGMVAIFNASVAGTYVVRLTVNNGPFKDVTITVDDNFPDPLNIKFAHVKNELQNVLHGTKRCIDCHVNVAVPAPSITPLVPPIWYSPFDRDGNGAVDATDDAWFLKALQGRVNLTEIGASALLRKPTGNHHAGLKVIDVADTSSNGGLHSYSILYNWILAGMPPGGVAANPIVSASNTLTFSGSPLFSAGIALDGGSSVGATNFLWSVSGPSGPTGAVPIISNPTSASAILSPAFPPGLQVPNVGTYVVQLHVDDGISSDAIQRIITVSEPLIVASFSPQTGSVLVTFSPSTNTGDIALTNASTYTGAAGTPLNCRWQVTPPAGVFGTTIDGSTILDITKSCGPTATLTVPLSAVGKAYQVQLTASTLGSNTSPVHSLTISNSAPTASLANTAASQPVQFAQTSTTSITTHATNTGGLPTGSAPISVVSASVTLNGSASTTPTGSLTYGWCLSSQPDSTTFPASVAICPAQTSSGASSTLAMTVRATGSYGVQLTVDNGSGTSTISKTLTISPSRGTAFPTIVANLSTNINSCSSCHVFGNLTNIFNTTSGTANSAAMPPWDNGVTQDGESLYQRVMQRVNLGIPTSSLLLVCPNAGCDFNGTFNVMPAQPSFASTALGTIYDQFRNWILDGAPPGN